jgi:hypothetical protein
VETIIEVYTRFSTIVEEAFCSQHGYKVALDRVKILFLIYELATIEISRLLVNLLIIMQ